MIIKFDKKQSKELGKLLKKYIEMNYKSQQSFSDDHNISKQYTSNLVNGKGIFPLRFIRLLVSDYDLQDDTWAIVYKALNFGNAVI